MLNRCVITVKAKGPFLEWVKTKQKVEVHGLEGWNEDGVAYLLPAVEDDADDIHSLLPLCYEMIFERELAVWCDDPAGWPATRDLKLFLKWFEPQLRSVVIDLVDAPLDDDEA